MAWRWCTPDCVCSIIKPKEPKGTKPNLMEWNVDRESRDFKIKGGVFDTINKQAKGTTQLNLIGLLGLLSLLGLLFLRLLLLGQIHDTSNDPEKNIGADKT